MTSEHRFKGDDGRECVSVKVADSVPFAEACIAVLRETEGRGGRWMLAYNAISVPVGVIPQARKRLEKAAR
jgi:hypothetical protein